jgi:hypothetical protein
MLVFLPVRAPFGINRNIFSAFCRLFIRLWMPFIISSDQHPAVMLV